mgnify:CR=1 FL=1|jgi:hypothetical protein
MRRIEDLVDRAALISRLEERAHVLEDGLADLLVPVLARDNAEQLSLAVGVQCPRIIVQSEEGMTVEHCAVALGSRPLAVEDLRLLSQVHLVVQCIVVELGRAHALRGRLGQVGGVEDVHDLNHVLHHLLVNDLLNNDNRDVRLKLQNCIRHHVLREASDDHLMSHLIDLRVQIVLAKEAVAEVEEGDEPLKDLMKVEVFQLTHLQHNEEAANARHHELRAGVRLSFNLVVDDVEQEGEAADHEMVSSLNVLVRVSNAVQEAL